MKRLTPLKNLDIILASEAQWRSELLARNNIPHRCLPHKLDEPEYAEGSLSDFVQKVALEKGRTLEKDFPDSMIISADQLISINNRVLGKPGNFEKAQEQLEGMNGQTHQLICAVAVIYQDRVEVACDQAQLTMRKLSSEEISNYLRMDRPIYCAGSYKIESLGASLFDEITTRDSSTIIGLPINLLISILRSFGFSNLL
ncbi:MAG: septum formation protein Maf [Proteobacteria bacterium]|nr:septum formation protein Maf [Pseudomonadota bacterium]